jgi:hypothetical protein
LSTTIAPIPTEIQSRPASSRIRWTFQPLRLISRSSGGSSRPFSSAARRSGYVLLTAVRDSIDGAG